MHGPHDPILVLGGRWPSAAVASEKRFRHIYGLLAAVVLCMLSAAAVGADTASAPPDVLAEKLRARIMAAQAANRLVCREELVCGLAELPRFYALRHYRPAWVTERGASGLGEDLLREIENARRDGLQPQDYRFDILSRLLETARLQAASGRPQDAELLADLEFLLTDAFLMLGSHLAAGRVNPETLHSDWVVASLPGVSLSEALAAAVDSGEVAGALQGLRPPHPEYESLRHGLERYRDLEARGGWPQLPEKSAWSRGQDGEIAERLQRRLEISGDWAPGEGNGPADRLLFEALRRFQARHGLGAGGRLDAPTLAALNVPVRDRIRQIELNLERWRWLPRDLGPRHIRVNVPDYSLQAIEEGRVALRMRVVVGRHYRRTPVFSSWMDHVVFNPDWNIPTRIAVEDILPRARKDPGYIARQKIRVFEDWSSTAAELDPAGIDWSQVTAGNFRYKLKKDPGAHNDLGRIKFMFPNKFSVYLHDTPSRQLFERSVRGFSSGCIRIEKPVDLAEYVLRGAPGWTGDAIRAAIDSGTRRTVALPRKIPLHLLYLTAWEDGQGELQFRADLYQKDAALDRALQKPPPRGTQAPAG